MAKISTIVTMRTFMAAAPRAAAFMKVAEIGAPKMVAFCSDATSSGWISSQ